ncbi:ankyrin repeat and LEM domain-containing protein 2 isoform X1 [Papilio machaon]|uniref:ankyrin repeat and LEM domain-containing protein 2 isoform X1 n=1 Tax=Papilio machaon TaxID=76193 RepID=UPI001E6645DF|nr:ankyrin repeat and LEM domain-containing protein 2 isoform X1 [Papilio machaon]
MSKAVLIPGCKDIGRMKEEISLSPPDKKDGAISLLSRLLRLDNLSKRNTPESPTSNESHTTYYGVYIPCEIKKGPDEEALHVYESKSEAMELVRRYKSARFKMFRSHQDAVSFALRGAEPTETHEGNNSLMGEKPYPFKAPSPQDMVALRKAIEAGLSTTVRDRIWDNPRYLVSSGNTPAIVQEGSRYNALHVAAKAMNAEICNLLLTTVGNPAFVQTLYGMDADAECCKEFSTILVDRYLNTPDKAMNETPLHFAAKFGAEAVVDVLTSFPQCNLNAVNKYGEQPKDIVCARASSMPAEVASNIRGMLRERYYVPVLHAEDGSREPTIGRPFSPGLQHEINNDPLCPRYEIRAFAGPMASRDAESFRRRWKTPPRAGFRLAEMTKGLETVGRNLAEEMKVNWKEYWPFLDTFTDLRTKEGLTLLENYLKSKYEIACSIVYNDSCAQYQHTPDELSLSTISLNTTQSPVKEPLSPISDLCAAMRSCTITDRSPYWKRTDPIRQRLCRQPTLKGINGDINPPVNTVNQLLCIERTCQVFAKRIADALVFSLTAEPEVASDSLKSEAKHLQHTTYTYMNDERFKTINFSLLHSRLAQLVVFKLKQKTKELDDVNSLVEFLVKLRCPNDDIFSSDDERKTFSFRSRVKISHVINEHVRCLSSFICEELTETDETKGPAVSETECSEIWSQASKCRCDWNIEVFERNSKKNASFRKNRSTLSSSPKSESFIRRLMFDQDIGGVTGDGKAQRGEAASSAHNSPAGDTSHYTVDVTKCQVVEAEISDDDSVASCRSDNEEVYHTASDHSEDEENSMMEDASDRALVEPFIYGEEPTKMDRLVYDALAEVEVSEEEFPNVHRWRHTVALYTTQERQKWVQSGECCNVSCTSLSLAGSPRPPSSPAPSTPTPCSPTTTPACSTPGKQRGDDTRSLSLQVSNWLRVTGPNSPRCASAARNVGHNVSFGF